MSLRTSQDIDDSHSAVLDEDVKNNLKLTVQYVTPGGPHQEEDEQPLETSSPHQRVSTSHCDIRRQTMDEAITFEQPVDRPSELSLLLPLMSRLPVDDSEQQDRDCAIHEEQYLDPAKNENIPGILPFSPARHGLVYTHARLPYLDDFSRAAWVALHSFRPVTTNYAGTFSKQPSHSRPLANNHVPPTHDTAIDLVRRAFNWPSLQLPLHLTGTLHGVVFRSKRKAGSTSTDLYEADRSAHEEAVASGGLLMYWYGTPDATGANLATCIWTDKTSAEVASRLPRHRKAVMHAAKAYATFELKQYRIVKRQGEKGVSICQA